MLFGYDAARAHAAAIHRQLPHSRQLSTPSRSCFARTALALASTTRNKYEVSPAIAHCFLSAQLTPLQVAPLQFLIGHGPICDRKLAPMVGAADICCINLTDDVGVTVIAVAAAVATLAVAADDAVAANTAIAIAGAAVAAYIAANHRHVCSRGRRPSSRRAHSLS